MKMTKRIIIKIIVAVAVAFILSKFRLFGIMKVNALTYVNKIPSNVTTFKRDGTSNGTANVVNFSANNTIFYGQQFTPQNGQNVETISFNYLNSSTSFYRLKNTVVQFVFFSTAINFSNNPYRFYIRDSVNSISTCYVENSRQYPSNNFLISDSLISDLYSTVYCPNVFISGDNFQVYATGSTQNSVNQTFSFGISSLSIMLADDSEQAINDIKNNTKETNDLIKNDDSSQAESKAEAFFEDFDSSDYGLKDVVLAPLTFIESLLNFQCSPLVIPLPFVSENVVLPCMSSIYSQFPTFYNLWQMITTGMVCYYVCINIFGRVKQLTDPMNDKIEVIQL